LINNFLSRKSIICILFLLLCIGEHSIGQFSYPFDKETQITLQDSALGTTAVINLPAPLNQMSEKRKTTLVFYALPNGNSVEWTMGKKMDTGDDWHYDIQHIAAQTRWLRSQLPEENLVVIYLINTLKAWPAWKRSRTDGPQKIRQWIDSLTQRFARWKPDVVLNSHSGGGSLIFGYLDAVTEIPEHISRIAFIDSEYGFEDSLHTAKLSRWLMRSRKHHLIALAYNDSVVIYNGKPLVSPTGGTWWRTQWMQRSLARDFPFTSAMDTALRYFTSLSNRIDIRLKINPEGKIFHTEQVARNGFIHSLLSGTKLAEKAYRYWGDWVYRDYIR
jgi:predicted alpha/beta hydrolase family esterase